MFRLHMNYLQLKVVPQYAPIYPKHNSILTFPHVSKTQQLTTDAVAIISACIAAAAIQPYCPTADELRNITALPGETRSAHQMDCRNFEPAVVIDDFFHLNFLFTQNMHWNALKHCVDMRFLTGCSHHIFAY